MSHLSADLWRKPKTTLLPGLVSLLFLACMIAFSPTTLCYDEPYHIDVAKRVSELGWYNALISPNNQSAAGPLFPAIHLSTQIFTDMRAPALRWVNFACLVTVVVFISLSGRVNSSWPDWPVGLSILAVPFLWPSVGMALTELPALAAFTLFIFCISKIFHVQSVEERPHSYEWAILAGLSLGLAILGRQTYLIMVPAVVVIMFIEPKRRLHFLVCLLVSAFSCGWLFIIWGGVVPPMMKQDVGGNLRIDHGILSLTYVTAATLFIRPDWLRVPNTARGTLFVLIGAVVAWFSRDYSSPPAKTLLLRIFGPEIGLLVGFGVSSLLVSASIVWLTNTATVAWQQRADSFRVFLFLTLLALIAAPVKVSHLFSSRYVVGLLGVLILVLGPSALSSRWRVGRMVLGSILGAASLWTYYSS